MGEKNDNRIGISEAVEGVDVVEGALREAWLMGVKVYRGEQVGRGTRVAHLAKKLRESVRLAVSHGLTKEGLVRFLAGKQRSWPTQVFMKEYPCNRFVEIWNAEHPDDLLDAGSFDEIKGGLSVSEEPKAVSSVGIAGRVRAAARRVFRV